jgi:hypothetical protein
MKFFIPLYAGCTGNLFETVRTTGERITELNPVWITPGAVSEADGINVFALRISPTVHRYEGQFAFEIWDKLYQSPKKWVATLHIDANTAEYRVELSERYMRRRLVFWLEAHLPNRIPDPSWAYYNNTPDGDWNYRDL